MEPGTEDRSLSSVMQNAAIASHTREILGAESSATFQHAIGRGERAVESITNQMNEILGANQVRSASE